MFFVPKKSAFLFAAEEKGTLDEVGCLEPAEFRHLGSARPCAQCCVDRSKGGVPVELDIPSMWSGYSDVATMLVEQS